MKLKYIVIPVVVIVVAIVAIVGVAFGNVDSFRPRIQTELQQKLNRPVTIGHLGLKLFPLSIKVEGLSIGESPSFPTGRPFATASDVFVSASLFSLIRGNPEVNEITLDKPQIEVVKNAAGAWNFSSLGNQSASSSSGGSSQFSLSELKLTDGQVGYTDESTKEPRAVYDHIDLTLKDFAPNKQFGIDLGVHFPGSGKQTLSFNGKAGPLGSGANAGTPPVNGHLTLDQVSLDGFNRFAAGTIPPQTDTVASGEADIKTEASTLSCKGNLKLDDTTIHGAKIDYPISAVYDLSDDLKADKIQVRSGLVQLGPTSFNASGDVDEGAKPANLNVRLQTKDSSITELAKLAGAFGVAFSPSYKVTGKLSMDVTAKGPITSPQLNGTINGNNLEASGGEIKQPVSVPQLDLALTPESVMSNNFTARSGATALSGAFTLSQYTTKNMNVDATLKSDGANIAELLDIAKAYGVDAAQGVTGTGKLSIDFHVRGPVSNTSQLAYAGSANISNAVINTPSLTKPLSIASANAKLSQNSVGLDNLVASLGSTTLKGNLSAKDFAAPQVQFALSADKIDADELQRITAAPAKPAAKPGKAAGHAEPSLLISTTGSGTLAVGTIKSQDIVLNNVNAKVDLNRGVIQLSPVSADAFKGKATGTITADMRPATPQCAVKMKIAGVDANDLLSTMSSVKNTVYGSLAADTDLKFALASSNELTRTLNGVVTFNLANGLIKNLNIMNEVEKVGKFLKAAPTGDTSGGGTALKKFAGTLNIVNGVATTNNLTGVLNAGSISANGTLNLVSQDINMHMNAVLGSSTSQAVGGSGVGGFLNTALANRQGELVVPVNVTGNMAHPVVTPDTAALAKMKLSGLLPTTGDPSKGVSGALGAALGGKGGIGGALGGLLGGGQQPRPDRSSSRNRIRSIPFSVDLRRKSQRSSSNRHKAGIRTALHPPSLILLAVCYFWPYGKGHVDP